MKKLLFIIFCTLSFPVAINAGGVIKSYHGTMSGTCGDNLTWSLDTRTGVLDIKGTGAMEFTSNILNEVSVSDAPWYPYHVYISSINLPDGLTYIASNAFLDCYKVTSITIPRSVVEVRSGAFWGCNGLTAVNITDLAAWCNIDWVWDDDDFYYSSNPLEYAHHLFLNGEEVTSLKIPAGVKEIKSSAFSGCLSLTSVTIPNTVKKVGAYAFDGCRNIKEPVYNSSIFFFLPYDYSGSYTIPSKIKSIAYGAFSYREHLTSLIMSDGIASIRGGEFNGCPNLSYIKLPGTLKKIESDEVGPFWGCHPMSISIPNSVDTIYPDALLGIPNIIYNGSAEGAPWGAKFVNHIADSLFVYSDATKTKIVACNPLLSGDVTIPNGVKIIGEAAFSYSRDIRSVVIPEGVTIIERNAFDACYNLTSIYIPSSVTKIEDHAFTCFSNLRKVYIADLAAWCNITRTEYSFGCGYHLYFNGKKIDNLIIPSGITEIKEYAFAHCSSIKKVALPGTVHNIKSHAFYGCIGLESCTIPPSVSAISGSAFDECTALTSLVVNKDVKVDGYSWSAFHNVPNVVYSGRQINMSKAKCINGFVDGWLVYHDATRKELMACSTAAEGKIIIPDGVKIIKKASFANCEGITNVVMPNTVTKIEEDAFCNCSNLTSVTIPFTVDTIEKSAFSDCQRLFDIEVPKNVKEVAYYAFYRVLNVIYSGPGANDWSPIWKDWGAKHVNCVVDSCLIYSDATRKRLIEYHPSHKGPIVIPKGVEEIGAGCFNLYQDSLTAITLPNTIKIIGQEAFAYCNNLQEINIPRSVTTIEKRAFAGCGFSSVIIPPSVKLIGEGAFGECYALNELYYPNYLDMSDIYAPEAKLIPYDPKRPVTSASLEPPMLTLVSGSVSFTDDTKDNSIDAGENAFVRFIIKNKGKGYAKNCEARVKITKGDASWINIQNVSLPPIPAGDTYEVVIPITANSNLKDGKITMAIEVYEPNGWGVAPFDLTVATKAYEAPLLQVVDYNVASASGKVKKMEAFTLTFNLQNTKYGTAENVEVNVKLPENVFLMDGDTEYSFPHMKAGEAQPIHIVLVANNRYKAEDIPINISVREKFGKYAENKQISIALNQEATGSVVITSQNERKPIELALFSSDVDRDIPSTNKQNKNTFVVIIGNEIYDNVDKVPYAQNDAKTFRQYCEKTLGIPAKNIREYTNATRGQIQGSLDWLNEISKAFNKPNFIIYYAGHGVPDEKTKESFLLPKDGYANNLSTCYKLNDFYETLGSMPAEKIIVFLDACFSGTKSSGEALKSGKRGIAIKADPGTPKGNTIVLAATTKDEPAYPYNDKQHGMFTYYLLKKMQSNAESSLGDLFNYIKEQVTQQSVLENDKVQTPQPVPSLNVTDSWKSWKLK